MASRSNNLDVAFVQTPMAMLNKPPLLGVGLVAARAAAALCSRVCSELPADVVRARLLPIECVLPSRAGDAAGLVASAC